MLTSLKCPNMQGPQLWQNNLFKVDQVIYSLVPISYQTFQAPSSNTFRDILLTSLKCPNLQKAITPEIFWLNLFKSWSGNLLIIPYQLTKFQAHSSNTFRDKKKMKLLSSEHFPHYKSMGAVGCCGNQNFYPICAKPSCSFSFTSSDATHKIWSRLANLPQKYSSLKVWMDVVDYGLLGHYRASNSKVNSLIWLEFKHVRDFMLVQITCKFHKNLIKTKKAMLRKM